MKLRLRIEGPGADRTDLQIAALKRRFRQWSRRLRRPGGRKELTVASDPHRRGPER